MSQPRLLLQYSGHSKEYTTALAYAPRDTKDTGQLLLNASEAYKRQSLCKQLIHSHRHLQSAHPEGKSLTLSCLTWTKCNGCSTCNGHKRVCWTCNSCNSGCYFLSDRALSLCTAPGSGGLRSFGSSFYPFAMHVFLQLPEGGVLRIGNHDMSKELQFKAVCLVSCQHSRIWICSDFAG